MKSEGGKDEARDPESLALEAELAMKVEALIARFKAQSNEERGVVDPKTAAEDLVEKAYEEDDLVAARVLVEEALVLHSDCVIAYLHLADLATEHEEAAAWLAKAVEAGDRELGRMPAPMMRQTPEVRNYLRARQRLADTLWLLQRHDQAVEQFKELLKLNPRDDQGIRYTLAAALLELGRDTEVQSLLLAYEKDDSASWEFCRALVTFRSEGDTPVSRNQLQKAKKRNRFVEIYLTGAKDPPRNRVGWDGSDLEFEAMEYVEKGSRPWLSTPGAMEWIKAVVASDS